MATYYVAASGGDNGNDGSSGSPWATLSYAVTRVSSGDIIYMQAGTHSINSQVSLPAGVSLTGAGESSVITSTSITAEWSEIISMESATISNGNQTISYLKFDGNNLIAAQALDIKRRHNVKIHHCTFVNFHYVAIVWLGDGGFVGGDPYDKAYPPTNYVTGSEFHDNTVTNCSLYTSFGYGALWIGGHDGMLLYNNSIIQNQRANGSNGYCIKTYGGWMKGWKVYNNTLLTVGNSWLFAIEGFFFMGCEFYDNTITGAIDVNFSWRGDNNEYDYGVWIHDNILGPASTGSTEYAGVILEFKVEDEIIERNLFRNNGVGIHHTMRYPYPWVYREKIRYNIFYNSGVGSYHSCIRFGETGNNFDIDDLEIYNNVFHTESSGGQYFGLHIRGFNTAKNVKVRNNIFMNFSYYWFDSNRGDYFDYLYIENNILYNNAMSNNLTLGGTPSHYTNNNNTVVNPKFTDAAGGDFTLQSDSPAIDAGMDLGLSLDYRRYRVPYGVAPDIGAYEYGSSYAGAIDSVSVNHLAFGGAHIGQTGKLTRAYNFTTNDYIGDLTARVSALELTSAISISAWFKTNISDSAYHTIVSNYSADYGYALSMNSSYQIEWLVGNGTSTGVKTTSSTYNDNAWHHVVATFDGTNVLLYIDGVLVGGVPATWNNNIAYNADCRYIVGARNNAGSGERFWEGMIDEIAIYNRELQLGDVEDLYNSGTGVTYPFY